jgi:hypothetical protein
MLAWMLRCRGHALFNELREIAGAVATADILMVPSRWNFAGLRQEHRRQEAEQVPHGPAVLGLINRHKPARSINCRHECRSNARAWRRPAKKLISKPPPQWSVEPLSVRLVDGHPTGGCS